MKDNRSSRDGRDHTEILRVHICCPHTDTDQAYYDLIMKRASALLSSVQLNMLKFALSLRAYSATVHSFQQVTAGQFKAVLKAWAYMWVGWY